MVRFRFNEEKAVTALLYISSKLIHLKRKADFHKVFKILYFADQKHLVRYGRPILGDFYIAMKDGPVPSQVYDILKTVRGDSIFADNRGFGKLIEISNYYMHPKVEPDLENFSETDLECLDESCRENCKMSFKDLREKSHDTAWKNANRDDKISYEEIAKEAGAAGEMLSYIKTLAENESTLTR